MNVLAATGLGAVFVIAVLAGLLYVQTERVDELTGDLRQAVLDRMAAERAQIAIADEAASAAVRSRKSQLGREAILMAPESENGVVAPVLERAFRAADEIGNIQ